MSRNDKRDDIKGHTVDIHKPFIVDVLKDKCVPLTPAAVCDVNKVNGYVALRKSRHFTFV